MAGAHLQEQVYGLSDLAESYDLDSDIASLADWLRLEQHDTHWQQGRTGPGGLNLNPSCKAVPARGFRLTWWPARGARPAQLRTSAARLGRWCAILHISDDTPYRHPRSWCSGQSSLAVCMRSMVQISILCIFLQDVLYACIRLYTDLYPDTQCLYTHIRSCSSIHVLIQVYNEVYRVLVLVCMLIYSV